MAFSEYLADRVRLVFERKSIPTEVKKMMGGLVYMVDGKMCVGVDKDKESGEDRLMARIGKEAYERALDEKGCREMDFTGTPMRGFVFIYSEGIDREDDLDFWVDKALAFNKEAKASPGRKKRK